MLDSKSVSCSEVFLQPWKHDFFLHLWLLWFHLVALQYNWDFHNFVRNISLATMRSIFKKNKHLPHDDEDDLDLFRVDGRSMNTYDGQKKKICLIFSRRKTQWICLQKDLARNIVVVLNRWYWFHHSRLFVSLQ